MAISAWHSALKRKREREREPRKFKEGSAITDLFTFLRGWGHDVIKISCQLSTVNEMSNQLIPRFMMGLGAG